MREPTLPWRSPPYEGGEILTSPSRNINERIQLTYSTSRLFYQLNHIKLCCCYQQYLSRRNYSHIGFWQILSVFRPVILALTLFRAGKRGEIRTHTVMILNHLPPANWATRSCVQLIYVLMELPTTLGFLCLYLTSLATSYVSHIVV